jgi:hypothetical protein
MSPVLMVPQEGMAEVPRTVTFTTRNILALEVGAALGAMADW